jgi:predicted DNA-binding transcriptional regulator YafY
MKKKHPYLMTLALDRMIEFQPLTKEPYSEYTGVDFERYFNDLIGVTKSERDRAQKVILLFDKVNAPYVVTKPLHHSQQILKDNEDGVTIRIDVVLNFELEKEILGFGECVKVILPRNLQARIKRRIDNAAKHYKEDRKKEDK